MYDIELMLRPLAHVVPVILVELALGIMTLASAEPQSRSPGVTQNSTPGSPAQTAAKQQTANPLTPEQRIALLEERLNTLLALKEEKILDIKDRIEGVYKLFQLFVALATVLLGFFSVRDVLLRRREGERQRGIDEIVKEMMRLQYVAMDQQVRMGALQVGSAERQPAELQNVNNVIDTVQKTLAFRLEQEQRVAQAIKKIDEMEAERERIRSQRFESAVGILDHLKLSRMQFATLADAQYKRAIRLVGLVGELDGYLNSKAFEVRGALLYACGVIEYYDSDIIEAKEYLDRAAQSRAPDHEAELNASQNYRLRFAFIHYFLALIQKNWGDISEALVEIDRSARLLEDRPGEFLTPVTRAEIRSYIVGEESRCRTEILALLDRMDAIETAVKADGRRLDDNQIRLRNRMLVLLGNTHYVIGNFREALAQYNRALAYNPDDYYALASAGQCYAVFGDHQASEMFSRCLNAIERSGDLRRKRDRSTRALIAVLAANAARGCGDLARYDQYVREARDLLSGNLAVDGMSPKFFSPATKRLVAAVDLLKEADHPMAEAALRDQTDEQWLSLVGEGVLGTGVFMSSTDLTFRIALSENLSYDACRSQGETFLAFKWIPLSVASPATVAASKGKSCVQPCVNRCVEFCCFCVNGICRP